MRKTLRNLAASAAILASAYCTDINPNAIQNSSQNKTIEAQAAQNVDYENLLSNAKQITLDEYSTFSIGRDYEVFVGDIKVGNVSGKNVKLWAEELTLTTLDGKIIGSEKENKRIIAYNRSGEIFDQNGKTIGHLAEERINDFFSLNYIFHFYDSNQNPIGTSEKFTKSSLGNHKIKDNTGKVLYDIDKHFRIAGGDAYTITVYDSSKIPIQSAIFITCIEDAIADSITAEENAKAQKERAKKQKD